MREGTFDAWWENATDEERAAYVEEMKYEAHVARQERLADLAAEPDFYPDDEALEAEAMLLERAERETAGDV